MVLDIFTNSAYSVCQSMIGCDSLTGVPRILRVCRLYAYWSEALDGVVLLYSCIVKLCCCLLSWRRTILLIVVFLLTMPRERGVVVWIHGCVKTRAPRICAFHTPERGCIRLFRKLCVHSSKRRRSHYKDNQISWDKMKVLQRYQSVAALKHFTCWRKSILGEGTSATVHSSPSITIVIDLQRSRNKSNPM